MPKGGFLEKRKGSGPKVSSLFTLRGEKDLFGRKEANLLLRGGELGGQEKKIIRRKKGHRLSS